MSATYPGVEWCPYSNRALRGAYLKAYRRAYGGELWPGNPYKDRRGYHGQITWSRAFIRAWDAGWRDGRIDGCASQGKGKRKGV
jgi:hypothetical protein